MKKSSFFYTRELAWSLFKLDLSVSAKLVLILLITCYNPKNKYVFPKQKRIAEALGISSRSVKRAIKSLIDKNLIKVLRLFSNQYELNLDIIFGTDNVKNSLLEGDKSAPLYITDKEHIKKQDSFKNTFVVSCESTQKLLKGYQQSAEESDDLKDWTKERAIKHIRENIPRACVKKSSIAKALTDRFGLNLDELLKPMAENPS